MARTVSIGNQDFESLRKRNSTTVSCLETVQIFIIHVLS